MQRPCVIRGVLEEQPKEMRRSGSREKRWDKTNPDRQAGSARTRLETRVQQTFSLKDQLVNILDFASQYAGIHIDIIYVFI